MQKQIARASALKAAVDFHSVRGSTDPSEVTATAEKFYEWIVRETLEDAVRKFLADH